MSFEEVWGCEGVVRYESPTFFELASMSLAKATTRAALWRGS